LDAVKRLFLALALISLLILVGVVTFIYLEGFTPLEALWLTVASLSTVGYGDIVPHTDAGRLFALFLIAGGVGLFTYALGTIIAIVVEGHLTNVLGRKRMEKKIQTLQDHIIICGAGRVGEQIIGRLKKEKAPFVVIDLDEDKLNHLQQEKIFVIQGNATEDATLARAGITKASGLVTSLPDDSENVFVTLTARGMNPNIKIVSRANLDSSTPKLRRAGADKVISPAIIGGRRMAISILKPASVDFVETLMYDSGLEFEIEEIRVNELSLLVGKELKDSRIKQESGVMVVAIKRQSEEVIHNPNSDTIIQMGDLLIVLGTRKQLELLEKLAAD